ncbi:MAG: hypothetical protein HYV29_11710 [Ignavibacteriales bacterium]|nr:hypothetical protein [Ignavibacteriales bacterium]
MKSSIVNSERRKFITKIGIGSVVSTFMVEGFGAFKLFTGSKQTKKNSEQSVSITINPMAVKRTK